MLISQEGIAALEVLREEPGPALFAGAPVPAPATRWQYIHIPAHKPLKCGCYGSECGCRQDHLGKQDRGWLLPLLLELTSLRPICYGADYLYEGHLRWAWWLEACETGQLQAPIPRVSFTAEADERDVRHVRDVLRPFVEKGLGWYDDAWLAFSKWLLWGFGYTPVAEDVERIPDEIRNRWYTSFGLQHLLHSPIEWSSFLLEGRHRLFNNRRAKWSSSTGFFSTPMDITLFMVEMLFGQTDKAQALLQTVYDPCVGTGNMLLAASNYSIRLYGQEIVGDLVLCTILNGYLWMPWLVHVPQSMRDLFQAHDRARGGSGHRSVTGVTLETDLDRVAATEAYRAGKLTQADFFGMMGNVSSD